MKNFVDQLLASEAANDKSSVFEDKIERNEGNNLGFPIFQRNSTNKIISSIKKTNEINSYDTSEKKFFEVLKQNPIFSSLISSNKKIQEETIQRSPDSLDQELKQLQDTYNTHLSHVKNKTFDIFENNENNDKSVIFTKKERKEVNKEIRSSTSTNYINAGRLIELNKQLDALLFVEERKKEGSQKKPEEKKKEIDDKYKTFEEKNNVPEEKYEKNKKKNDFIEKNEKSQKNCEFEENNKKIDFQEKKIINLEKDEKILKPEKIVQKKTTFQEDKNMKRVVLEENPENIDKKSKKQVFEEKSEKNDKKLKKPVFEEKPENPTENPDLISENFIKNDENIEDLRDFLEENELKSKKAPKKVIINNKKKSKSIKSVSNSSKIIEEEVKNQLNSEKSQKIPIITHTSSNVDDNNKDNNMDIEVPLQNYDENDDISSNIIQMNSTVPKIDPSSKSQKSRTLKKLAIIDPDPNANDEKSNKNHVDMNKNDVNSQDTQEKPSQKSKNSKKIKKTTAMTYQTDNETLNKNPFSSSNSSGTDKFKSHSVDPSIKLQMKPSSTTGNNDKRKNNKEEYHKRKEFFKEYEKKMYIDPTKPRVIKKIIKAKEFYGESERYPMRMRMPTLCYWKPTTSFIERTSDGREIFNYYEDAINTVLEPVQKLRQDNTGKAKKIVKKKMEKMEKMKKMEKMEKMKKMEKNEKNDKKNIKTENDDIDTTKYEIISNDYDNFIALITLKPNETKDFGQNQFGPIVNSI